MSDNTTPPTGPEGQDPNANPYGQDPYGSNPYGQQPPAGNDPYGQNPYGQPQYGQPGYGQDPYGQQQFAGGPQAPAYSVGTAFSWAWQTFKAHLGTFLALGAASFFGSMIFEIISMAIADPNSPMANLLTLIGSIVSFVVSMALVRAALDAFDGKQVTFGGSFSRIPWIAVVLSTLLVAVLTGVGLVLCIIPGLIAALMLMFTTHFIIDRNVGVIAGLKGSFNLVKANVGAVILLALSIIGVAILGMLALCLGLIVAIPLIVLAQVYTYRALGAAVSTD